MTGNELVEWHHQLNGYEFEQALGDGEGQGSLECCRPCGCKESDMTVQLNDNNVLSNVGNKKSEKYSLPKIWDLWMNSIPPSNHGI